MVKLIDIDFKTGAMLTENEAVMQFLGYLLSSDKNSWFFRPDLYVDIEQYLFSLTDEANAELIADYIFDDIMRAINVHLPAVDIDMAQSFIRLGQVNGKYVYLVRFYILTSSGEPIEFSYDLGISQYLTNNK